MVVLGADLSAIKNFGDFWDREKISWGSQAPGDRGHLKGYLSYKKSKVVDFRTQIAVYVLYDENVNVVYVGQTGGGQRDRLFHRLRFHRDGRARNRWRYFSWFGLRQTTGNGLHGAQSHKSKPRIPTNKAALDEIEFVLLRIIEPKLNLSGGNWKSHEIERYVQWYKSEAEDTVYAEKKDVKKILKQLEFLNRSKK